MGPWGSGKDFTFYLLYFASMICFSCCKTCAIVTGLLKATYLLTYLLTCLAYMSYLHVGAHLPSWRHLLNLYTGSIMWRKYVGRMTTSWRLSGRIARRTLPSSQYATLQRIHVTASVYLSVLTSYPNCFFRFLANRKAGVELKIRRIEIKKVFCCWRNKI